GNIKKVACNLQARYFDKNNRLIDIFYDRRLAETMWVLLRDGPFYWGEKELKKFVGAIKKDNLDLEDSFERLYRRISSQLLAEEEWQNKEYKPIAKLGRGKWIIHDRHKEILSESYNEKLLEIAILCEREQFKKAKAIAKRFNKDQMMKRVIDNYQRELGYERIWGKIGNLLKARRNERLRAEAQKKDELKAAADSDLQNTNQTISVPAPPSLPPPSPEKDPNKDKKQKEGKRSKESPNQFRKGHTFDKHGSHKTHELQMEAKNTGQSLGQWTDNNAVENFIAKNLDKTKNGTIKIELPEGLGR
ncbi:unnamed protein product, partial [marine sediment metagenome]